MSRFVAGPLTLPTARHHPAQADHRFYRYAAQAIRTCAARATRRLIGNPVSPEHDLVFATRSGAALDAANVRREFRAVCTAAKIGVNWTSRGLRHSFVSLMSTSGVPVAALRMTRRCKIALQRDDWLRKIEQRMAAQRRRLPAGERVKLLMSLRPTTFMDFLCELRRRSNYEGVDEYGSDAEDANVARFHRGMLHIPDVGLLHYEIMLVQFVGLEAYEEEVLAWIRLAVKIG